ncbi:hypothetical protein GFS60_06940 (plasmid) [Rhodococcus sp. WAY2]|nr:hypothetical protein GFS60_06940 [Rhodococcus sp. WAY2]
MERSIQFYTQVVGLRVSIDREEKRDGVDRPFHRRAVYLRWDEGPGSGYIVLDQQFGSKAKGAPADWFDLGIHHAAVLVADIDATLERAREKGYPALSSAPARLGGEWSGEPSGGTIATATLRDPDGNLIQVEQWLDVEPATTGS